METWLEQFQERMEGEVLEAAGPETFSRTGNEGEDRAKKGSLSLFCLVFKVEKINGMLSSVFNSC